MAERKNAKAMAGGSLQDRSHTGLDVPLQGNTDGFWVCLFLCIQIYNLCANVYVVYHP